jgi:hypothetical protein
MIGKEAVPVLWVLTLVRLPLFLVWRTKAITEDDESLLVLFHIEQIQ